MFTCDPEIYFVGGKKDSTKIKTSGQLSMFCFNFKTMCVNKPCLPVGGKVG